MRWYPDLDRLMRTTYNSSRRDSYAIMAALWDEPRDQRIAQIAEFHRPRYGKQLVWC